MTATTTFYRLSGTHRLPSYCSYRPSCETVCARGRSEIIVDNRTSGALVWAKLADAVAATIDDPEGDYRPENGCDRLLWIDADGSRDLPEANRPGPYWQWRIVDRRHVLAVRSVDVRRVHEWLTRRAVIVEDANDVRDFVSVHESAIAAWLDRVAEHEPIEWHDTLPLAREVAR